MRHLLLASLSIALFALGPALLSAPANAAELDWWWIGGSTINGARQETYVDHTEIKVTGNRVDAWVYYVVERPFPNGEVMALTRSRVDCKRRTVTYTHRVSFDQSGKEMSTTRYDALPPSPIKENTSADALRRHLCRDKPLPARSVASPTQDAMIAWGRTQSPSSATPQKPEPTVGYGTGFFVDGSGNLVTSYHVVDGAKMITIYTADKRPHRATVMKASPATDLAILHVEHAPTHYLSLAPSNVSKPGDRVFTFGFPVVEVLGTEPKFTDGAISSLSGAGDEAAFAQITVPVQPGNSGGPLVNERGEVVGVIAAAAATKQFIEATGALPQNVNWAVRSEYLSPLIGSRASAPVRSREEAVAHARKSVVIVFVEK